MQDKYINATKLIERLKCEKRREVAEAASNPFSTGPAPEIRISQIYDGVVSVLEKEPAANVVPRPAPKWPICQNCGRPMVYCGEENTDGIVWKRYSCKDCYNQFCARRMLAVVELIEKEPAVEKEYDVMFSGTEHIDSPGPAPVVGYRIAAKSWEEAVQKGKFYAEMQHPAFIPFAFAGPVIEVPKAELENLETEKK